MRKKKTILYPTLTFFYLLFTVPIAIAQSTPYVTGYVKDKLTNEVISGAEVYIGSNHAGSDFRTGGQRTDNNGQFRIDHKRINYGGEIYIEVKSRGYRSYQKVFYVKRNPELRYYDVHLVRKQTKPSINPELPDKYFNRGEFERAAEVNAEVEKMNLDQENHMKCSNKMVRAIKELKRCNLTLAAYIISEEALHLCSTDKKYARARTKIKGYLDQATDSEKNIAKAERATIYGNYSDAIKIYEGIICNDKNESLIRINQELQKYDEQARSHFNEENYLEAIKSFKKIRNKSPKDQYAIRKINSCNEKIFFALKKANERIHDSSNSIGDSFKKSFAIYDKYREWLYRGFTDRNNLYVRYDDIIATYELSFENTSFSDKAWKDVLSTSLLQLADIYYKGRASVDRPSCKNRCAVVRGTMLFILVRNGKFKGRNEAMDHLNLVDSKLKTDAKTELKREINF